MKSLPPWFGVLLLLCVGCRKSDTRAERVASAAGSGSALTALRTSEQESAGLRVETGVLGQAARWGYSDLALDAQRTQLRIHFTPGGAELQESLLPGALAALNGGYFEPDFRPSTWLVDAGVELSPKADTSKGGVLALGAGGIYLGPMAGLEFAPVLAVQSFPLVVEAEGKAGVYSDDGRRAARTIACLVGPVLHFIVISAPRGDGPTLFETATLLREPRPAGFACRRALNLDGGPSTGVLFAPAIHAKQRRPLAKVAYAIAIMAR